MSVKSTVTVLCLIAAASPALAQWPQPQPYQPQPYVYRPPLPAPAETSQRYLEQQQQFNQGNYQPVQPPPRPVYCQPVNGNMVCR